MPRTISTKPAYSVRFWKERGFTAPEQDAFELLRKQAAFRYESPPPSGEAWILHRDMRQLAWISDQLPGPIGLVVTSPPDLDVTNFEEDQWLRLWFLGGPPYPTRGRISRDDRYERPDAYWGFIADMWRMLGSLVAKNGHVVIRMGGRGILPEEMITKLASSSQIRAPFREDAVSDYEQAKAAADRCFPQRNAWLPVGDRLPFPVPKLSGLAFDSPPNLRRLYRDEKALARI